MEKTIIEKITDIKNEIAKLQEQKKKDLESFLFVKNQFENDGEKHELLMTWSWHDDEIEILQKKLKKLEKQLKN